MFTHPATVNLKTLSERGVGIIELNRAHSLPDWRARGAWQNLNTRRLDGFVVAASRFARQRSARTAGPTHEPIDAVRFIGNRSSGKMGYALADASSGSALKSPLSGPVQLSAPKGVHDVVKVQTALKCSMPLCSGFHPQTSPLQRSSRCATSRTVEQEAPQGRTA